MTLKAADKIKMLDTVPTASCFRPFFSFCLTKQANVSYRAFYSPLSQPEVTFFLIIQIINSFPLHTHRFLCGGFCDDPDEGHEPKHSLTTVIQKFWNFPGTHATAQVKKVNHRKYSTFLSHRLLTLPILWKLSRAALQQSCRCLISNGTILQRCREKESPTEGK